MAKTYNCTLDQGATWDDTCYPPWDVTNAGGELFDLSDYSARSMMRKKFTDTSPAATFTCTIDTITGTVQLSMTAAQTAAIPAGTYYYDIELYTLDDSVVRKVVKGVITVNPEATK